MKMTITRTVGPRWSIDRLDLVGISHLAYRWRAPRPLPLFEACYVPLMDGTTLATWRYATDSGRVEEQTASCQTEEEALTLLEEEIYQRFEGWDGGEYAVEITRGEEAS